MGRNALDLNFDRQGGWGNGVAGWRQERRRVLAQFQRCAGSVQPNAFGIRRSSAVATSLKYTETISNLTCLGCSRRTLIYRRAMRRIMRRLSASTADSAVATSNRLRVLTSTKHKVSPSQQTR